MLPPNFIEIWCNAQAYSGPFLASAIISATASSRYYERQKSPLYAWIWSNTALILSMEKEERVKTAHALARL